eukprot:CAMPEP_0172530906 /NCGR_PEP_ID=MMETSP1067-20121228/4508_1 /TAXON_ID=265564 ORGANISM="Thalassiosira punctigera, Strain Tpunct2005C2" /NCGR_SAMPLE_ID=MMETSP1067 /ASSEMBLY_ACC=CAM_ASM_000444 /LENGTH=931 /DNA_ID=CAMNT_0013315215 /DNA_START=77 /DNA_END=2872 /DNA_ORIENTATION=+
MTRTLNRGGGNDNKQDEETKSPDHGPVYDFDFELSEEIIMNNSNNKPPPQPATAAANSIHWDVDEDHLLSYFLGATDGSAGSSANENNGNSSNANKIPGSGTAIERQQSHHAALAHNFDAATALRPSSQPNSTGNMASIAEGMQQHHHHSSLENFARARSGGQSSSVGLGPSAASPMLPATPAVHFYDGYRPHNRPAGNNNQQQQATMGGGAMQAQSAEYNSFVHASQQQRQSAGSLQNRTGSAGSMHKTPSRTSTGSVGSRDSSSSSLTSMAAALALGGPNQVMFMQQKLQARADGGMNHLSNTSPITPLNMMGSPSGQEMMMLPPPPRFPNGGMMMQQQSVGQMMQQQHIMHTQQQQQQQQNNMQQQPSIQQQNMQQQLIQQHIQQIQQNQQLMMQQVAGSNFGNQQQNNQQMQQHMMQAHASNNAAPQNTAQSQQPNFLPQMNPPAGTPVQHSVQHPPNQNMGGFPDPNSVMSTVLAQPQQRPQQQQQQPHMQPQEQQQQQVQQQPQTQQIQIGLNNGQTIPLTAIPTPNGSVYYQIDPNAAMPAGAANSASLRYFTKAINEVSKADENKEIVDPEILAEKRRQRLARNRESARQSRRRKKEHLSNVAAKVRSLQRQLETEVRNKVRSMEAGLVRQRSNLVEGWLARGGGESGGGGALRRMDALSAALARAGPNCQIRRAVVAHQYGTLRQAFLSTHNQFAVWMMMHSPSFFTEASHRKQGVAATAQPGSGGGSVPAPVIGGGGVVGTSKSSGAPRANSKQIGEEIFNEERSKGGGNGKGMITCDSTDQLKTWPLYCHEITMTMEQEERIIHQAHGQAKNTPNLLSKLQRMKTATDATRHLQNATLCHARLASQRNEALLLEILTPEQTALFLEYARKNKKRLRSIMDRRLCGVDGSAGVGGGAEGEGTLGGVCRQLEEMRLQGEKKE